MTTIGYARISRADLHVENQVELLKEAGAWPIFKDEGISGSIPPMNRREFKEMVRWIEAHRGEEIDLLVFEISRISRKMVDTLVTIKDLESRGCMVKSLSPKESFMNIEDPSIRSLIHAIIGWVAERERENLIERTKAGLERARREGKTLGRPRVDLTPDEIRAYREQGYSFEKIGRLEDCSTSTVTRILRREDRRKRGLT